MDSTRPPGLDAPSTLRALKAVSRLNAALYRATDGRVGGRFRAHRGFPKGIPVCLLTTRGRKSGRLRTAPLLYLELEEGTVAVVASQGGTARNPMWYRNILDEPRVVLQTGAEMTVRRARTATPEERAELWPRLVDLYPEYADYQSWTDREIPVVLLEHTGR
ncbi:nitroreductase family deazaflavin-dependent oxidoreductase [Nocardiopsis sp. RSe5-2]|uniref:Nitroreductase family deazaflavin-dependent oxidoreductase n=1 Tax=Nocardiopsis endophytica TaxID=3018445 RepID=A0ABT4U1N8_9ACTN|nr:nitroreductase family deazaflavin-dependent oxidoreductase [Nocardiopsis endophytica]MDA2810848.1 nitroreductase family deazaflavin-dependent oxidoreductase [Nocardiopsis endophytica]